MEIIKRETLPDKKRRGEIAVNYLREKYNQEFAYSEVRDVKINENFFKVIAYAIKNPYELFEVRVPFGSSEYTDEFAIKEACNQYVDKMFDRIEVRDEMIYVRIQSLVKFPGDGYKDFTLEEFQEKIPENKYQINVFYANDLGDESDVPVLVNRMLDGDDYMNGVVLYYNIPEKMFPEVQNYLESNDKIYMDFNKVIGGMKPVMERFEKGKIKTQK